MNNQYTIEMTECKINHIFEFKSIELYVIQYYQLAYHGL